MKWLYTINADELLKFLTSQPQQQEIPLPTVSAWIKMTQLCYPSTGQTEVHWQGDI